MAALCARLFNRIPARTLYTSAPRLDKLLDDTINVATGLEKKELLAEAAGQELFDVRVLKRGKGTKDCPNEVTSACDARIVGCICEEDATTVLWMWLYAGKPRRCYCGHWFKLVYKPPVVTHKL